MKRINKKFFRSLLGMLIPFLSVSATVTISLFVYIRINSASNGDGLLVTLVMLITIVTLSVLLVICDRIQRKITMEDPVQEILDATQKISSGDFSIRLESSHIYDKYNNYDLIKDNLNKMVAELEKSEILKNNFVSNISHEIKTPLAIIQNYIVLLQGDLDEETKNKYIQTVTSATKRLNNLVTNALKLNKLEHQELNLECEKIRLHDMLSETVISFEEIIDKKHIDIQCYFDEVEIVSSYSSLELVWNNLLSNAVKFTDDGGKITVKLYREGKNAVVEVADTGCGISPETGAHIFDKFYQGDTSHSCEGNGLGLSLVKKVIDVIGGEISVISELGKGSTFKVVLKEMDE